MITGVLTIQAENSHKHRDGNIADNCDGQVFRQHPLFSRYPCALQIILYYDEVVNLLGRKMSKHKVGNKTFFVLYCIKSIKPPYHRKQTRYQEDVNAILNTFTRAFS